MAAKVKEAVFDAHLADAQQILPEACQRAFDVGLRRDEIAVQLGAIKTGPGAGLCGACLGLRHEGRQIEGRNDQLRDVCVQRAEESLGTLIGADTLGQVVVQALFGRRQRGDVIPIVELQFRPGWGHGAKAAAHVEALDGEAGDFDQNRALRVGERDVEARHRVGRVIVSRVTHPADHVITQGGVNPDRPVGHRHPERRGVIAGDQIHGPAGGDVHEAGMQEVTRIAVSRSLPRQDQVSHAFAVAQRSGAQHAPAGAEIQMRLLRAAQGQIAERCLADPGAQGGEVHWGRRGKPRERQRRLRMHLPAATALMHHGAGDPHVIARFRPGERHAHLGLFAIRRLKRAQEGQIADLERAGFALGGKRLCGQFQIAGAGQKRPAIAGAVFVQHPMRGGGKRGFKQAMALRVECGHVQKRRGAVFAGGLGQIAGAGGDGIGGHADLGPDAPVERQDAGLAALPGAGIGVEVFIGGDVIHLTGGGGDGGGGGEQNQPVERAIGEELIQHLRAVNFRGQHIFDAALGFGEERAIVDHASGMNHAVDGAGFPCNSLYRGLHPLQIADICLGHDDPRALGLQRADRLDPASGGV